MASSLRPCAVHHSSSIEVSCGTRSGAPRSAAAAGEVRRARSAAARMVVFMSLFPLSNIMLIQPRVRHLSGDRPGKNLSTGPYALSVVRKPTPASSSATPTVRRSPTCISRRSRDDGRRRISSPATRPDGSPPTSCTEMQPVIDFLVPTTAPSLSKEYNRPNRKVQNLNTGLNERNVRRIRCIGSYDKLCEPAEILYDCRQCELELGTAWPASADDPAGRSA
jgi:hypothetical protein